jgi:hypothetical protein
MKRIVVSFFLLTLAYNVFSQADIDGFRGKKWDTPFEQMSEGMQKSSKFNPGFKAYEKDRDDMLFEGIKANTITYLFKKELFAGVIIAIYNKDVEKVVAALTSKYGDPKLTETSFLKNYEWVLPSTDLVVSYFISNASEESASIGIRKQK